MSDQERKIQDFTARFILKWGGLVCKGEQSLANLSRLYDAGRFPFASQLVNIGVSREKVSRLLGHSTTKMTARYIHHDLEKLKIVVNAISLDPKKIEKLPSKKNVDNS